MPKKITTKQEPTLLQVAQLGHKVIRTKAKEIADVSDPKLQELIDAMIATCEDSSGVGIAAPQVYESIRMFIVASYPSIRYPKAPKMKPTAMINPKIIFASEKMEEDWEGCLSIPGIRGLVPRHTLIKVEYTDREGKKQTKTFKDFIARVFQHEYDHLDGIVFLDRSDPQSLMTEKEFLKMIAKRK